MSRDASFEVIYLGPSDGRQPAQDVLGPATRILEPTTPTELGEALRTADAVVDASTRTQISREMLALADNLAIISCASTGTSHIDHEAAERLGVQVRSLREDRDLLQTITPAAEHTWALALACARQLPNAAADVLDGHWRRERFPGVMLRGKTLGIVGCGRIGQWVGGYGRAFGMDVIGHDPFVTPWPDGIRAVALTELFEGADVITIHVHLTPATHHLVTADLLDRCRPGTILVNTSRGGVVDEQAVLDSLASGRLNSVGLDVLEDEPDPSDSPIVDAARSNASIIITPHVGGFSPDALALVVRRASEKVLETLTTAP